MKKWYGLGLLVIVALLLFLNRQPVEQSEQNPETAKVALEEPLQVAAPQGVIPIAVHDPFAQHLASPAALRNSEG